MKALSMTEPWASLLAHGIKDKETRSWAPPPRFLKKTIAIHAAMKLASAVDINSDVEYYITRIYGPMWRKMVPRGHVIATAVLDKVFRVEEYGPEPDMVQCTVMKRSNEIGPRFDDRIVSIAEDRLGDFSIGRYIWQFRDVQLLECPVKARGMLGLWEFRSALDVSDGITV